MNRNWCDYGLLANDDSDDWLERAIRDVIKKTGITNADEIVTSTEEVVEAVTTELPAWLYTQLESSRASMLEEHREHYAGFHNRLDELWGDAFDLLKMLQVITCETGEMIVARHQREAIAHELTFGAIARLHMRGCLVFQEILHLLRGGFAAGANARWRTLHETEVTAAFLLENGQDAVERYVDYGEIESYKALCWHQQHCEQLGVDPYTDAEIAEAKAHRDEVCGRFGKDFGRSYAWAAAALGKTGVAFADIEQAVKLSAMRPLYRMACQDVHASVSALTSNLGAAYGPTNLTLSCPSNAGLALPGVLAARTLTRLTSVLLSTNPTVTSAVLLKLIMITVENAEEALLKAKEELERQIADKERID